MRKILLTLTLAISGCTSVRYIPVETMRTDSMTVIQSRIDSIVVKDSTTIDRTADTVRITQWRIETRMHTEHDTVRHTHTDTITVIQAMENQPSASISTWLYIGTLAIGICAGLIVALLIHYRLRR